MTAREWFERVRRSAAAIEPCRQNLAALVEAKELMEPWGTGGGGGSKAAHSDPTATTAMSRMDGLEAAISDLRNELDAHVDIVGEGLKVLEAVRSVVGKKDAETLELYYVDCASTWSDVAAEMGLSVKTVRMMRDYALFWVDKHVKLA